MNQQQRRETRQRLKAALNELDRATEHLNGMPDGMVSNLARATALLEASLAHINEARWSQTNAR
jgi:hypothetical protein